MLKRDTRRQAAKAMLKQSRCYGNSLTICMYAEDITLQAAEDLTAIFPGIGKYTIATPETVPYT